MRAVCYGDSNTYGYDPRSYFGGRYNTDARWVDLLAEKTGWNIQNAGMNGRQIPQETVRFPDDTDLLILMLGTNDLLEGRTAADAAGRMEVFLRGLDIPGNKILLLAPPPMRLGAWVASESLIEESKALALCYRRLSSRLGIHFIDAGEWLVPLSFDGVHFTEEGHKVFAAALFSALKGG